MVRDLTLAVYHIERPGLGTFDSYEPFNRQLSNPDLAQSDMNTRIKPLSVKCALQSFGTSNLVWD